MPDITLNGERRRCEPETSIFQLLQVLGLQPAQVAVERNREIVPRATYESVVLAEGDQLEIVTFVGGG